MRSIVILLALLLLPATAAAGWTAVQTSKLEGTGREDRAIMYFDRGRLRIDSESRSYMIDMKPGLFTFLDHDQKVYAKATLDEVVGLQRNIISRMKDQVPQLPEHMQKEAMDRIAQLEKKNSKPPQIKRSGKKQKISGYACELVSWEDDYGENQACVTTELPVDVKPFIQASSDLAKRLAEKGASNATPTQALFHLPGLPIHTRRTAGAVVSITTLAEITKYNAKPETFAVPTTYEKRPLKELVAPGL